MKNPYYYPKMYEVGSKTDLIRRKLTSKRYKILASLKSADFTIYRAFNNKGSIEITRKRVMANYNVYRFYVRSLDSIQVPYGLELGYDAESQYPYFVREDGKMETSPTDLMFGDVDLILQANMCYGKSKLEDRILLNIPRELITSSNFEGRGKELSLALEDIYTLRRLGDAELKGVFTIPEWMHLRQALRTAHVAGSIKYMTSILKQYIKDYDALYPDLAECSIVRLLDKIDCLSPIHIDAVYRRVALRIEDENTPPKKRESELTPLEEWANW